MFSELAPILGLFSYDGVLLTFSIVVSAIAVLHVLLTKTNSLAALLWIAFFVAWPLVGPVLYWIFGVNRVWNAKRRASFLRLTDQSVPTIQLPDNVDELPPLQQVGGRVTGRQWLTGCRFQLLKNGEEAFPNMLQAINEAQSEILLATYIFDRDDTGLTFIQSLAAAKNRGVRVKVLVDDVGRRYSFPTITGLLSKHKIDYLSFMPLRLLPPSFSINLRNHRKLLIIDQKTAFAGGMNIGDRQLTEGNNSRRAADLHFRVVGPAVGDLRLLFVRDWQFSGGEELFKAEQSSSRRPPLPRKSLAPDRDRGEARVVPDGPDEQLHHLNQLIAGVVSAAQSRVVVVTPYFLPNWQLVGALKSAALRGVAVTVILPHVTNLPIVRWATNHGLWELLTGGVRVLEQPPPFAHAKCLLVDDCYALVGSANIDARSLRLNFEVGIETLDHEFVAQLDQYVTEVLGQSTEVTLEDVSSRTVLVRFRDAVAGLLSPYL